MALSSASTSSSLFSGIWPSLSSGLSAVWERETGTSSINSANKSTRVNKLSSTALLSSLKACEIKLRLLWGLANSRINKIYCMRNKRGSYNAWGPLDPKIWGGGWGGGIEKIQIYHYKNQKKSIFSPKLGGGRPPPLPPRQRTPCYNGT